MNERRFTPEMFYMANAFSVQCWEFHLLWPKPLSLLLRQLTAEAHLEASGLGLRVTLNPKRKPYTAETEKKT